MRGRKAPEELSVSHSISCTPLQWTRMRELAERAGMRTSPYIVGRVLKREGFGAGEAGHALVLDGKQQRGMHDAALGAAAALSGLSGDAYAYGYTGLRETVALLFEARLDEMAREGRRGEMEALLASVTGPERAAALVRRAVMRAGGGETAGAG